MEADSKVFEVKSIFVWQPIPIYQYDQNNMLLQRKAMEK
jgi:hypothetical protein